MRHKTALLADALSVPFHPDEISEVFNLDQLRVRLVCLWAGAQGLARHDAESGFPATYTLVGDAPTLAIDFASTILRCETLALLAAKE